MNAYEIIEKAEKELVDSGVFKRVEEIAFFFKKWTEVVLIIIEKWRFVVSTHQGMPMLMAPVAMIADADIADERTGATLYRHGKCLRTIGCGYDATVAICLFLKCLTVFHQYQVATIKLLIPLYRTAVCCGKYCCHSFIS